MRSSLRYPLVIGTSVAVALTPRAAQGQTTAPPAAAAPTSAQASSSSSSGGIDFSGFVDFYFGYNFNTPASRQAQIRNFDVQHNAFNLNLAEAALERKPTSSSRAGFRLDLDFGSAAQTVNAAEPAGSTVFQNVLQAYVSYLAPAGHGLQLDFGKFVSPIGNETIKSRDSWNYSRSLLFTLAEPYYHAGVRATYPVDDRVTVAGFLVNGWNNVTDNNGGKSVGGQLAIKATPALTITQTYLGGPEQTNDNSDWRHIFDTIATYTATPTVSLAANYDYGRDTISGAAVTWQGIAGYLRYQARPWFAITPRVEYYDDPDGVTTGVEQKVKEVTLTGEFAAKSGVQMRVEFRRDFSNEPFFLKDTDTHVNAQSTLTVGVIYTFNSKIQ